MSIDKFESLKITFQEVINCIAKKDHKEARIKWLIAEDLLNEMLDITISDQDLITLRQYQLLLNQLKQRIELLN